MTLKTREWRYATKQFDATKKVSEEDLATFLEAVRLSASSYGLQPYHIYVITDKEIREKLKPASWGQSQITDASHLIVFAHQTDFNDDLVDDYIATTAKTRDLPIESLKGYGDLMKSNLMGLSKEIKSIWTAKQAYLALGNALQAAAELNIDACPMEGFEADKYNAILGLDAKGQNVAVVLPIGYRSDADKTQHHAKVRKSKEDLFTYI